ncbi:hypothetical protein DPSP01_004088 [Paraphaeosphaeria sporulosa]|uniref:Uncharacterized protein n=1 Tax=Paraphaeosphaeria sporulosa TaxID=1460663 RepID=A0A177CBY1_9PLEO|nr:uncharacterized protein CC84DRAFT_1165093 [Paraphaeosphaeria sporulosa]OAG04701.1 hypothetical protein CC84DRAFT_1165093 [Paraphaeosphaeria sporulosa]
MLKSFIFTSLALVATAVTGLKTPTPPGLEFLYSLNCSLGEPFSTGVGPYGEVRVIPITGGYFEGPKIKGDVLNLGADWNYLDNRGTGHPDTRYQLRTDDGANIFIKTAGSDQPDGVIHLRGIYETGSEKYFWLNYVTAVGILKPGVGYVTIDMWYLKSPSNGTIAVE